MDNHQSGQSLMQNKEKKLLSKPRNISDDINKMRNLLSKSNRQNNIKNKREKQINFSHTHVCTYSQHLIPAQSIFHNENTDTFISYNEKSLHSWSPNGGENLYTVNFAEATASKQISCITYSVLNYLYFACSKDFKLLVFNEHLNFIQEMSLDKNLVLSAQFYDEKSQLITAGKIGCFIYNIQINYKYKASQAILLDPKGASIKVEIKSCIQLPYLKDWVKGLKVDTVQNKIIGWTPEQICFYHLKDDPQNDSIKQGSEFLKYKELTPKDDFVTDILLYTEMRYFVTATHLGNIILWKLTDKNNKVNTFKGHSRAITSLYPVSNNKTQIVSASLDGTIRTWCIEKMIELYCFDISQSTPECTDLFNDSITNIELIDDQLFAVFYRNVIEVGKLSHLALSFAIQKQKILNIGKSFTSFKDQDENKPSSLYITFDDNSIILQNPENGNVKSTIYPPPTPTAVDQVIYCMRVRRMFILLKTGNICVYKCDKDTATLEKLKYAKEIKDYEGKSLTQSITSMSLVCTEPAKYDFEILSDLHTYKENEDPSMRIYLDEQGEYSDGFLVFGLSKGSIIFVKVTNIDSIYAKFPVHKQAVEQIYELKESKKLISVCREHVMMIWGFENKKFKIYKEFNIWRKIMCIKPIEDMMLLCFDSGDSELLLWNEDKKNIYRLLNSDQSNLMSAQEEKNLKTLFGDDPKDHNEKVSRQEHYRKHDDEVSNSSSVAEEQFQKLKMEINKSDEHDARVTSIDIFPAKGLIVSGDCEGTLKIWNLKKELMREIKFTESITAVCFFKENADIVVGHGGKLSKMSIKNCIQVEKLPSKQEIKTFKENKANRIKVSKSFFKELKDQEDDVAKQDARIDLNAHHHKTSGPSSIKKSNNNKAQKGVKINEKVKVQNYLKKDDESEFDANNDVFDPEIYEKALQDALQEQQAKFYKIKNASQIQKQMEEENQKIQQELLNSQMTKGSTRYGHSNRRGQSTRMTGNYKASGNSTLLHSSGSQSREQNSGMHISELKPSNVRAIPKSFLSNTNLKQTQSNFDQSSLSRTRRMLTEDRIMRNILIHNNPMDHLNKDNISIICKQSVSKLQHNVSTATQNQGGLVQKHNSTTQYNQNQMLMTGDSNLNQQMGNNQQIINHLIHDPSGQDYISSQGQYNTQGGSKQGRQLGGVNRMRLSTDMQQARQSSFGQKSKLPLVQSSFNSNPYVGQQPHKVQITHTTGPASKTPNSKLSVYQNLQKKQQSVLDAAMASGQNIGGVQLQGQNNGNFVPQQNVKVPADNHKFIVRVMNKSLGQRRNHTANSYNSSNPRSVMKQQRQLQATNYGNFAGPSHKDLRL